MSRFPAEPARREVGSKTGCFFLVCKYSDCKERDAVYRFILQMATRTCIGKATIKYFSALPYSMVGTVISSLISTSHPIISRIQLFYTGRSEAPITQRRKENEDGTKNRYTRSASDKCGWPVVAMEKLRSRGRLESDARKNEFRLAGRGGP